MIKKLLTLFLSLCTLNSLQAEVITNQPAPDFTLQDSHGQTYQLSKLKGKTVVLEWFNHSCPFVVKHYSSGNMQALQKKYTAQGIIWLAINSSSKDSGSYQDPEKTNQLNKEKAGQASAILIDETGDVGRSYGAKTTPHMYIIDSAGVLRYQGAIDTDPSPDPSSIAAAENYISKALDAIMNGQEVNPDTTKSYGCSVKY